MTFTLTSAQKKCVFSRGDIYIDISTKEMCFSRDDIFPAGKE